MMINYRVPLLEMLITAGAAASLLGLNTVREMLQWIMNVPVSTK